MYLYLTLVRFEVVTNATLYTITAMYDQNKDDAALLGHYVPLLWTASDGLCGITHKEQRHLHEFT